MSPSLYLGSSFISFEKRGKLLVYYFKKKIPRFYKTNTRTYNKNLNIIISTINSV